MCAGGVHFVTGLHNDEAIPQSSDKMDVFCWLQHYVAHTRQPSLEYQTCMFVLLKYGVPVEQKVRVSYLP